jgi:branched-chain amino acid transport system ATP-binding protein
MTDQEAVMLVVNHIDVYRGGLKALWDISISLSKGEIIALVGANGTGKSTFLETIAGLLAPSTGMIHFEGIQINGEPSHRIVDLGICLVPEDRGIFPGMNVLENLELGAFNRRGRAEKEETLCFVYGLFPILKDRRKQLAKTLSGGEQQMLAIGKGLLSKPKLLMLDEPSLGLAPLIVKNIFEAICQINQTGVSVLLVEQNVRIALKVAKRAYVIENGRIVTHEEAKNLLTDKRVRQAYLGIHSF